MVETLTGTKIKEIAITVSPSTDPAERMIADIEYWVKKRRELREKYPNQWFSISNGEVVASGTSMEELISALAEKDISLTDTVTDFSGKEE